MASVESLCKRFVIEELLPFLNLSTKDVRVTERQCFFEEESSPYHPQTVEGLPTVCVNHFIDAYIQRLPMAVIDKKNRKHDRWSYLANHKSTLEPIKLPTLTHKLAALRFWSSDVFFSAEQVLRLLLAVRDETIRMEPSKDPYRVMAEVMVALYSRLSNPKDVHIPLRYFVENASIRVVEELQQRLGWLNLLSQLHTDYPFSLDLQNKHDHWVVAHMLARVAFKEGGENIKHPRFCRKHGLPPTAGWQLQSRWDMIDYDGELTKGIPKEGSLAMSGFRPTVLRNDARFPCAKWLLLSGIPLPRCSVLQEENIAHVDDTEPWQPLHPWDSKWGVWEFGKVPFAIGDGSN